MGKSKGKQLLNKYRNGTISPEELRVLESWYADTVQKAEPFDNPAAYLRDMEILDGAFPFDRPVARSIYRLWPKIAIAAAIAVVLFGAGLFYFSDKAVVEDVMPGKNGATLTLADGRKIRIGDAKTGELAKQSGIRISKSPTGEIVYTAVDESGQGANELNILQTSRKEQTQIQLPDGTKVWLNAASSLKYPASFKNKPFRSVELLGEAYFQVSADRKHPFKVLTRKQEVRVLGTHFNINAYSDEPVIKTTLLEGSVKISADHATVLLKPGEQAELKEGKFTISGADTDEALSWKNGDFVFHGERIESVMRKLARWYDIEVIYDGEIPEDEFYAEISKFRNISQVLTQLEKTKGAHFKIAGRRVIVSRFTEQQ